MTDSAQTCPDSSEYPPYYAGYVDLAPEDAIVDALCDQGARLVKFLSALPPASRGYRYAEGKWTTEEVLGHIADCERLFSYRAMCFLRGVEDEQPGVDQDAMVPRSLANERGLESLTREFEHLRIANVELFTGLGDTEMTIRGRASGGEFSVRALLSILYGHAEHHAKVLRDRYVPPAP